MNGPVIVASLAKNKGETVRVTLDTFRDHRLLDVRVFTVPAPGHGDPVPTPKGVAVRIELIGELADALNAAKAKACEMGWLRAAAESTEST